MWWLGAFTLSIAGVFAWSLIRTSRNRMIIASEINVEISELTEVAGVTRGTLILRANGIAFFWQQEMMLTELAGQLREWAANVDDDKACREFSFCVLDNRDTYGLFRIIPRPVNWQFHSKKTRRVIAPLPLDVYLRMAARIIELVRYPEVRLGGEP